MTIKNTFARRTAVASVAAMEAPDMPKGGTVIVPGSTSDDILSKATALAAKESPEMGQAITRFWDAKEETAKGTFNILDAMVDAYGVEGLLEFPIPDSEGGNNPDKFKMPKQDKDGKTTMRPTSFYVHYFDKTKEGAPIVARLEQLSRLGDDKDNGEGIDAELIAIRGDISARRLMKEKLDARRSNGRAAIKKAISLFHAINAINEMPGIEALVCRDPATGEVVTGPRPIQVFRIAGVMKDAATGEDVNVPDFTKQDFLSIGGVMLLEPKKALEQGGTWDALMATKGRAPKKGTGGATSDNLPVVKTADTFDNYLSSINHYVQDVVADKKGIELGAIMKKLSGPGSDGFLLSVFELGHFLNNIMRQDRLSARYQTLINKADDTEAKTA